MSCQLGTGESDVKAGIEFGGEDIKIESTITREKVAQMKNKKIANLISWVAIVLGLIVIILVLYKILRGI